MPPDFARKVNRLAIWWGTWVWRCRVSSPFPVGGFTTLDHPGLGWRRPDCLVDAAGGWNIEAEGCQSVGSGSFRAVVPIKKPYLQTDQDSALKAAVEAPYDAADDDSATGGPDLVRGIYPTAVTIDAEGANDVPRRIARLARQSLPVGRGRTSSVPAAGPTTKRRGWPRELSVFPSPEQAMRERSDRAQGMRAAEARLRWSMTAECALRRRESFAFAAEVSGCTTNWDSRRSGGSTNSTTCGAAEYSSPIRAGAYDRRDVTGWQLANVYAQTLGTIFTEQAKPYEVELCVAEVAHYGESNRLSCTRITYDGSIADEPHFLVAMGGATDPILGAPQSHSSRTRRLPTRSVAWGPLRCRNHQHQW